MFELDPVGRRVHIRKEKDGSKHTLGPPVPDDENTAGAVGYTPISGTLETKNFVLIALDAKEGDEEYIHSIAHCSTMQMLMAASALRESLLNRLMDPDAPAWQSHFTLALAKHLLILPNDPTLNDPEQIQKYLRGLHKTAKRRPEKEDD